MTVIEIQIDFQIVESKDSHKIIKSKTINEVSISACSLEILQFIFSRLPLVKLIFLTLLKCS